MKRSSMHRAFTGLVSPIPTTKAATNFGDETTEGKLQPKRMRAPHRNETSTRAPQRLGIRRQGRGLPLFMPSQHAVMLSEHSERSIPWRLE